MYEKVYSSNGELIGIKIISSGKIFTNGAEVIDNPPTQLEVLNQAKSEKIEQVKAKTKSLIISGMEFDNVLLSTSEVAQLDASIIFSQWEKGGYSKLDGEILTRQDNGEAYLLTTENIPLYANQMLEMKRTLKKDGRLLHAQINACTTIEEVEGIVDSR